MGTLAGPTSAMYRRTNKMTLGSGGVRNAEVRSSILLPSTISFPCKCNKNGRKWRFRPRFRRLALLSAV